jgi:hypothetical protein
VFGIPGELAELCCSEAVDELFFGHWT